MRANRVGDFDTLLLEERNQILCAQTDDTREAMTAFMQRRTPDFKDC